MTAANSGGGRQLTEAATLARTLKIGRGIKRDATEDTIDLRNYSHLTFFSSSVPPAQYTTVILSLEDADRDVLRPVLRDIDWLLAVGGRLEVFLRGSASWAHFVLHVVLGRRFSLVATTSSIVCVKLSDNDNHAIDNRFWSIAVISGGNNEPRIERLIASVERQRIPDVELLVVGPAPRLVLPAWCRHVAFEENPSDPRFEITAKKNLAAQTARHDNMLVIHDRYRLADDWYSAVLALRGGWDVLVLPSVNEGQPDITLDDWVAFVPQAAGERDAYRVSSYCETYPADFRRLDHVVLDYAAYSERMTVNGGAFAVKRSLLRAVPLDPRLHWAEIEDGDWSERVVNHGAVISLAHGARLENLPADTQHASAPRGLTAKIRAPYNAARKAARSVLFSTISKTAQRLGQRKDLFRGRGVFSNDVGRLTPQELFSMTRDGWPNKRAVLVRGDLERRLDLRAVLEQMRRHCPKGSELYLELATSGVGYFTRGTGVRNCEVLMYEVSLVLGNDFELRSLFCSSELSFLVHLVRTRAPVPHAVAPLVVVADDDAWVNRDEAVLNALDAGWQRAGRKDFDPGEGSVLLLRDPGILRDAARWRDAYNDSGLVSQRVVPSARLLDGNLLCSRQQWLEFADGCALDPFNWCDAQRAEVTAILRGRWSTEVGT